MRNGGASSADEFVELLEADLPNAKRLATQHVVPIALKIWVMCGRCPGKNFLTDDIGCAQMVPEGAVECLIKDRDALLTF